MGIHSHDAWELSYVLTGRGIRTIGDVSEEFSEGDMVLIPPGTPHFWSFDPSVTDRGGMIENITVIISEKHLEKIIEALPAFAEHIIRFRSIDDAVSIDGKKAAARMLAHGEGSVTDICYACGFNDVSYFSRTFRRNKGCSPSEYKSC